MLNNRQANRRRGRGRGPQNNGGRNDNASRIDSRARGNAPQMLEKYKNMARDAQMQGDRVMTEYYLQFADHYFRIVAESRARFEEQRRQRDDWNGEEDEGSDNDGNFDSGYGNEGDADGQQDQQRDYRQNSNNNRQDRDRGDRNERSDRNDRGDRSERPERAERPERNEQPRRQPRRDDRGPREAVEREPGNSYAREDRSEPAPRTIDVAVLPPALGVTTDPIRDIDEEPAPTPKRRGRPRKIVAEEAAEG